MPASKHRSLTISASRRQEIEELAETVAEEHCPNDPIAPESIARANRMTLSYNDYGESYDGLLEHRDGRFHIYCNLRRLERRDSPRARFTIAHELGHYYIDDHRTALEDNRVLSHPSVCDFESRNPVEHEADIFASNLLMPTSRFLRAARGVDTGLAGILKLADRFLTSVTSTAIRYTAFDVSPCVVIKWNATGFAWKWLSPSTWAARLRKTFESLTDVPTDSATGMAFRGETPPERGYFECGNTVAAWFPAIAHCSDRNAILVEQAMALGRFGVITFLYPASGTY